MLGYKKNWLSRFFDTYKMISAVMARLEQRIEIWQSEKSIHVSWHLWSCMECRFICTVWNFWNDASTSRKTSEWMLKHIYNKKMTHEYHYRHTCTHFYSMCSVHSENRNSWTLNIYTLDWMWFLSEREREIERKSELVNIPWYVYSAYVASHKRETNDRNMWNWAFGWFGHENTGLDQSNK